MIKTAHNLSLTFPASIAVMLAWSLVLSPCVSAQTVSNQAVANSPVSLLTYRVRQDFSAPLNADSGWAAPEGTAAMLRYDEPFRLRVQVRASHDLPAGHLVMLQYRWAQGPWLAMGVADFPYPRLATPVVSIVSTPAYEHGAQTVRLLGSGELDWDEGLGLNAVPATPNWRAGTDAVEWEWPLVIRRFSDGPTFARDNRAFELRLVDGLGRPLAGASIAALTVSATPGHLGGTFVETPGRLGPYQNAQGHLYFFMEPTETDNRFMAVRSSDYGQTWQEVDGVNRPTADDLEGVASTRNGSVIHLLHQVTREVFYHSFHLGELASGPGAWLVDSQSIATPAEPATQFADIAARSDGSLVAFYSGARRLFLQVRTPQGNWETPREIDQATGPDLSGPVMATGPDDTVTLAYTGRDGRGFVRHLLPDGRLTPRQVLASNLGSDDAENGAILPLVVLPESGETVVVYREQNGLLYERRFTRSRVLSPAVQISALPVATNAVDSEQAGADLVVHESTLHLVFIQSQSRSILYTRSAEPGMWTEPEVIVEGIDGSWLRGSIHQNASGRPVYGFVYDAGSRGGSGMNRYLALPL